MNISRVIALAVVAALSSTTVSQAQKLRNADQPAEFPPASYKSTQYVDSRGCVYVRAGISGNITWVPRVTRARTQICNQKPSLGTAVAAAAPAKQAKPPVQITLEPKPAKPKPVAAKAPKLKLRKVAAAPKPTPKPVRKTPLFKKPVRKAPVQIAAAKPIQIVPQPKPVVRKVAPPAPRPAVRQQSACAGASAVSQHYLTGNNVRCGPQSENYYSSASAQSNAVNGATRIVPKHVYIQRQNTQNLPIPTGYRSVWEDDRLNPKRAEQSVAGQAAVKLIWTSRVPRRLIEVGTGRDVTSKIPLIYPYVDVATQTRDLGLVSIVRRDGKILKRIKRNPTAARQPVLSSRSAPKAAAKPAPARAQPKAASAKIIQVGTYGSSANAQSVAKRLQRMGLPVRIGKYTRGGKTYRRVEAGPFAGNAAQHLSALRRAGFRDAFLR